MALHIRLLGEQSITDRPSGEVRVRSSRTVALVALLILRAEVPQARQHLAGRFWPESSDAQALTNLRRELHGLRRELGDNRGLVVTQKDLLWQDSADITVDLRLFESGRRAALAAPADSDEALVKAVAAVEQYAGELLPGMYDDWVLEARAELQRQYAELCELICRLRSQRGEPAEALPVARRLIQLDPLVERSYRTLMELQADLGDRAGAVSTYHRCASVLERELGVVPDEATQRTLRRVMDRYPHRGGPAPEGGRTPAIGPSQTPAEGFVGCGSDVVDLVGRSQELALVGEAWRSAASGRPGIVVVRGSAGVGKTRLIGELAAIARRGGSEVAVSQCFGTSGRLALAPVAGWLRAPAARASTARLEPLWQAEVERLAPIGPGRPVTASGDRAMVDAWQRHRFFEGVARALLGVDRPLLLVLDNLQWCDRETLAFLTFLLGLASGVPVLVAATLRVDDPDDEPTGDEWVLRMRATGQLTEVTLHPLDAPETASLAEAMRGTPLLAADRDLLYAVSGGFPLHVVEAMRTVGDASGGAPLPLGDLAAVLRRRLDQASGPAQEIAGLAAAVGRDFTLDLLVEASDLDACAVVDAVDELWRRRILSERGGGYDFSHDRLRDAAYAEVSPPRRWLLHRRLAQGLELLHPDDVDQVSALLAEQYALGGRPGQAVVYYQRAATLAAGVFAHDEAIRLHSRALFIVRAGPRGPEGARRELAVLEAMAAPLNACYGYASSQLQTVLERSIALAESVGRTDSELQGLLGLFASRIVQGRIADAHRLALRALSLADPDCDLVGPAHFAVAGSAIHRGMPGEAVRHFETAARLSRGASLSLGTHPDVHGPAWAAHAHWLLGHDAESLASCRYAVDLARASGHPYSLAVAVAYSAITHQLRGDPAELPGAVQELSELCERYGFGYYREWALVLGGWFQGGTAGLELARRGIDNLKTEGAFLRMPYWLSLLAELQTADGRPEAARSTLDAAEAGARIRADVWWLPEVQRLRSAHDQAGAAVSRLRSAAALATEHGSLTLVRRCERDLAERSAFPAGSTVRPAR
jgi:DNA-binding SARP family transcriptional activator/tetratricopeptide (TPR) repeat protein